MIDSKSLEMLKIPFIASDVEWRVSRSGVTAKGAPWLVVLAYVTNRAIMDRLDKSVGIENWRNEYTEGPCGGVLCGLSIRVQGEWLTKWDGAENTAIDGVKGGLSGAMKRAAVQWGIGRYLYNLGDTFANVIDSKQPGCESSKVKGVQPNKGYVNWFPPQLPAWAVQSPGDKAAVKELRKQKAMASIPAIVEEASDEQKTKLINEAKAMGDSYKLIPQITALLAVHNSNSLTLQKKCRASYVKYSEVIMFLQEAYKAQINTIAPEVKLVCTDCGNGSVGIAGSKCQQCSSTNKLISQEGN